MIKDKYLLVLEEDRPSWFTVSAPAFPGFVTWVTGFESEAKVRARRIFIEWLVRQHELECEIPAPDKGGYVVFTDGARKIDDSIFWSKLDVQRVLGISRTTVDRRVADGTFRKYRCGGKVLFNPLQIRSAICSRTIQLGDGL